MKLIKPLLIASFLFATLAATAQDYNPFKSIGKKGKILTLSKGKYVEVFDYDTIQSIGTVLYNIRTKKVVKLLDADKTFEKFSDNSSASRWYSPDPLAAKGKNISYSPYVYTFNNPINYVDPDGQDGIKVIDNKNKTITIRAVYYVQTDKGFKQNPVTGYSEKDVKNLNESINKTLNGKGYSVSEGDYKGYSVKFDLAFKSGGTLDEAKDSKAGEKVDGISVGNTFTVGDGNKIGYFKVKENEEAGTESQVGGVTESHTNVTMNSNTDTKRNRIHEVFHTLFFDNDDAKNGIGSYQRSDLPNQGDINKLVNNATLPAIIKKDEEKK